MPSSSGRWVHSRPRPPLDDRPAAPSGDRGVAGPRGAHRERSTSFYVPCVSGSSDGPRGTPPSTHTRTSTATGAMGATGLSSMSCRADPLMFEGPQLDKEPRGRCYTRVDSHGSLTRSYGRGVGRRWRGLEPTWGDPYVLRWTAPGRPTVLPVRTRSLAFFVATVASPVAGASEEELYDASRLRVEFGATCGPGSATLD